MAKSPEEPGLITGPGFDGALHRFTDEGLIFLSER